jgi:uncharacterized protein (DUF433 family)
MSELRRIAQRRSIAVNDDRSPSFERVASQVMSQALDRTNEALQWVQRKAVAHRFDRITQNPNVLGGRATIRGLRISVAHVVNLVANDMTPAQIVAELPDLEPEDIRQALGYAAALAQDELHSTRA